MSYIDSTVCVTLQWNESSERQILLRNMDFEASGIYGCEVSTQTPIYTKLSNDHELTVIRKCVGGGSTEHESCPVREYVRCVQNYISLRLCVQLQEPERELEKALGLEERRENTVTDSHKCF